MDSIRGSEAKVRNEAFLREKRGAYKRTANVKKNKLGISWTCDTERLSWQFLSVDP